MGLAWAEGKGAARVGGGGTDSWTVGRVVGAWGHFSHLYCPSPLPGYIVSFQTTFLRSQQTWRAPLQRGFDLPPGLNALCKTLVTRGRRQCVLEWVAPGLAVERRKEFLGTEDE